MSGTAPAIHPDLKEFLSCLRRNRVRFVVGGSYVLATVGRPRFTKDLDVLVEPTKANAKRLAIALAEFGFEELAKLATEHFSVEERMATLGVAPLAIDLLTSFRGITFRDAWRGRREIDVDGVPIPFLGLQQFIDTKRASGRAIDRADLALLEEIGLLPASARKPTKRG